MILDFMYYHIPPEIFSNPSVVNVTLILLGVIFSLRWYSCLYKDNILIKISSLCEVNISRSKRSIIIKIKMYTFNKIKFLLHKYYFI